MSVEFLGSQTLLDFHRVIVEMARDTLWTNQRRSHRRDSEEANDRPEEEEPAASGGYFFFEDTFYTAESNVDYTTPIRNWLASLIPRGEVDAMNPSKCRRLNAVGLSVESVRKLKVAPMSETRLEDIALRLGVRYVHVHNGNLECSVFCVDRRLVPLDEGLSSLPSASLLYPVLHDVWTLPYATSPCDACQHRTAVFVSAPNCAATDGGPRPLCHSCAKQLQVPASDLELYSTYMSN
jgi:hypothetical protein